MTDLPERLIALRDAPGSNDEDDHYFLERHVRELLTEAANRIEELERDYIELGEELGTELAEERTLTNRCQEALGLCLWVLINRHNASIPQFEEDAKAAEEDARAALNPEDDDDE